MKLAVIYIRVSTARQAGEGVSMDAQLERARAWCKFNGYEVNSEYQDAGISGGTMLKRPGLLQAIDKACQFKAALVVYSLSRLARSTKDALSISERLNAAGADLVSLTEAIDTTTAAGKMIFRMLAVLAEFERDVISERTITALAYKKANGQKTGGAVPYGYFLHSDGSSLIKDETEQAVIRTILGSVTSFGVEDATQRSFGYNRVARQLNRLSVGTRSGVPWTAKVVRDIYRRAIK